MYLYLYVFLHSHVHVNARVCGNAMRLFNGSMVRAAKLVSHMRSCDHAIVVSAPGSAKGTPQLASGSLVAHGPEVTRVRIHMVKP